MDASDAARRWGETWQRAWPVRDQAAISALYHRQVVYMAEPFRAPMRGMAELGAYFTRVFAEEEQLESWFGEPVVEGQRASIEWWATLIEDGVETSLVGTSTLRFDADGLVVEQRDTWNQTNGRTPPPEGWGR